MNTFEKGNFEQVPQAPNASDRERTKLGDEGAQEIQQVSSGKLHEHYANLLKEAGEEKNAQDKEKLKAASVIEIRKNIAFLNEGETNDPETRFHSLKEETARRIMAYTSSFDNEWYTLDYQQMGTDEGGFSHELFVGLGDILLDPDVKEVLVNKGGHLIRGTRGIAPNGRVGFLDSSGNYVATHTGDKFKILTDEITDEGDQDKVRDYLENVDKEQKSRDALAKKSEELVHALDFDLQLKPGESLMDQLNAPLNSGQRQMGMLIEQKFIDAGLSREVAAAAIVNAYHESSLNPHAIGDRGKSVGLFQLHENGGGHGMSVDERRDPIKNIARIVEIIQSTKGASLRSAAANGTSVSALAAIFSRDIERPADTEGNMLSRAQTAMEFFGFQDMRLV